MKIDLLLQNLNCVTAQKKFKTDIAINQGKIVSVGQNEFSPTQAKRVLNLDGATAFPGVIDSQVHFRWPGLTHKEDIQTGSQAAVLGGVCSFFEMPNTKPSTINAELLQEKVAFAAKHSHANYAFFLGATAHNLDELKKAHTLSGCCGIKIFLGSSTGDLLLYHQESLRAIFNNVKTPISIHSEDEEILKSRESIKNQSNHPRVHPHWRNAESSFSSTQKIIQLAHECQKRIHLLHITTLQEMQFLQKHKDICSVEVTPQHLTLFAPDCYEKIGTLAQMNPPIREQEHFQALWNGIKNNTVDVIGSDHAPHTLEEKERPYPHSPSGMPGVQTLVPIMLTHVAQGKLDLEHFVKLTSSNPAAIFGLKNKGDIAPGMDADLTIVELNVDFVIKNQDQKSKVGWTPFNQFVAKARPLSTIVAGKVAMLEGQLEEHLGENLFPRSQG